MLERMGDTTPEAAEVQRRLLREMSSARKTALTDELCETARTLAIAGIRGRHPDYSEGEARYALWRMMYGDDLFRRAWPDAPVLAP